MLKRIIAIAFIFAGAAIAWVVLGGTIFSRTYDSNNELGSRVVSLWGAPQAQSPPSATVDHTEPKTTETVENGKTKKVTEQLVVTDVLPVEASRVDVNLELDYRQKGLLWYSTYRVAFLGDYAFRNTTKQDEASFTLKFPTEQAIYDDLVFTVDGEPVRLTNAKGTATGTARVKPGETATLRVGYRSQGLTEWRYNFGSDVSQVKDFRLKMRTNFKAIDFPENTLSPSEKRETPGGWELVWNYKNLVSGFQIAMLMPEKLQPGPLAGRISFFAPVSLFFFFFLMFIITTMRGIELHPMNYFFLAAAFFSFHLLLAYLVDHVSIHWSFAISSVVSVFLVISYLRLVVGTRFAAREAGLAQFIYLVMFSYAFFFKGFTGLAVTTGSILTLFVVMQITGRVRWADKFAGRVEVNGEKTTNGNFAGKPAPSVST
ncbi:MAG: inner membrane CreD family protein [Acidobacteria bacterium]|nr:inner membrane CreD family protein [Acidobacteriota bacterium]MCA1643798.1 inner membrane CreD family protein [Acidobacteriota bacterium]